MIQGSTARRLIRNYCWQKTRIGRSKCKRFLKHFLETEQVVELFPGLTMALDLRSSTQEFIFWFYEEMEPALQWAIQRFVPKQGLIVDCGANSGIMGLLAVASNRARALLIEPHPRLASTIRKSIALSKMEGLAHLLEVAASDREATASLYIHERNDGSHSLMHVTGHSIEIRLRPLEKILLEEQVQTVDFLKVDAEGHDFQVLKGCGSFLNPGKTKVIYCEMGEQASTIIPLLASQGYIPFYSRKLYIDGLRKIATKPGFRFFDPVPPGTTSGCDWLWISPDHPQLNQLQEDARWASPSP